MIRSVLQYGFLRNALYAAVLASVVCGVIGTIITEKKLVMMSGGIAHTAFGGIGLGYFLKIEPIIGALGVAVGAAIAIVGLKHKTGTNADLIIGLFWSVGMALGVLFIALTPGYPPDISSYLFGNILAVTRLDLRMMLALAIVVLTVVVALYQYYKAYLFDEDFAQALGIPTLKLEYLLFVLIAFAIVTLIRVVGITLIIALLTAPPALAKRLTYNLKQMMVYSVGIGFVLSIGGLWVSYTINLPSGASIIILAGLTYTAFSLLGAGQPQQ